MFDAREIDLLRGSFSSYFERVPEARKHQAFTSECFEEIFVENPRYGCKLFGLLEFCSK